MRGAVKQSKPIWRCGCVPLFDRGRRPVAPGNVSRKVRITAKRRDEVDIEKLALALLGLIRDMEAGQARPESPKSKTGGAS